MINSSSSKLRNLSAIDVPLAINETPGTTISSFTQLPAFQGRTLYAVNDVLTKTSNYTNIAQHGVTSNNATTGGGILIQQRETTNNGTGLRIDLAGGSGNIAATANGRIAGRHVYSLRLDNGMTTANMLIDSTLVTSTATLTPGNGILSPPTLVLYAANTNDAPIAAYLFATPHDDITRRRIMGWLGRRYNGPIPSGY